MMLRLVPLALILPLLGCSEAQMCRYRATASLHRLDREISTAQENIARGYEVIEITPFYDPTPICRPVHHHPPGHPPGDWQHRQLGSAEPPGPAMGGNFRHGVDRVSTADVVCWTRPVPEPREFQRPINVPAEKAKLASLQEQRARLLPQAEAALAACPAE